MRLFQIFFFFLREPRRKRKVKDIVKILFIDVISFLIVALLSILIYLVLGDFFQ